MKTTILLNNLEPNCLDDCIISSINLSDKKLEVFICKEGIPADLQQEKNANKLVVSFIIRWDNLRMGISFWGREVDKDIEVRSIVLNENETINAKWVSKDKLQVMNENQEVVRSVTRRFDMLKGEL